MLDENWKYQTPLNGRYPSDEMNKLWSNNSRYSTWRKLWVALAETEKELGIDITEEQINQMKEHIYDIDYKIVSDREKECRHDVMAHIYEFGIKAPLAKPIIHLGATSCYVTDNTEVILMKQALEIIEKKIIVIINNLKKFAEKYKDIVCLGYTHFQPAQLTTVGKRATLWIQDLVQDLEELNFVKDNLKLLGCKGTTGTEESFMKLFQDEEKVKKIDSRIAEKIGLKNVFDLSGQTYTRKQDSRVLNLLSNISQSSAKFANDIRLLQHEKELEEPFETKQIGSSAMAYKRNPMRSERINSLSRYVLTLAINPGITASTQWLERTLDDSANRRLCISEAFLTLDSILKLYANISNGIVVYEESIKSNLKKELPFMCTEEILMKAVLKGGDRQELHEKIRIYSMEEVKQVKQFGKENNLISRIAEDESFKLTEEEIEKILNPKNLCGRAVHQVEEYIENVVNPILNRNKEYLKSNNFDIEV